LDEILIFEVGRSGFGLEGWFWGRSFLEWFVVLDATQAAGYLIGVLE
jgi:hypothetical protein